MCVVAIVVLFFFQCRLYDTVRYYSYVDFTCTSTKARRIINLRITKSARIFFLYTFENFRFTPYKKAGGWRHRKKMKKKKATNKKKSFLSTSSSLHFFFLVSLYGIRTYISCRYLCTCRFMYHIHVHVSICLSFIAPFCVFCFARRENSSSVNVSVTKCVGTNWGSGGKRTRKTTQRCKKEGKKTSWSRLSHQCVILFESDSRSSSTPLFSTVISSSLCVLFSWCVCVLFCQNCVSARDNYNCVLRLLAYAWLHEWNCWKDTPREIEMQNVVIERMMRQIEKMIAYVRVEWNAFVSR